MPKKDATGTYQASHSSKYGLKISARHPGTSHVISAVCRFCTVFGREENVGGKRARTANVKYFSTFRTDGYKRHLTSAHSEKWEEYKTLITAADKEQFFKSVPTAFVNTLDAHFETSSHLRVLINGNIVEVVVGDLLFHPDDLEGVTHERALELFKKLNENGEDDERDVYEVVIRTRRRFNLCIKFVACGASFRMASRLMECTKTESGMSVYGGCSDVVASNYTRIVCAHSLQKLSDVMQNVWAFSLALDGSTHQGMSYLDVRIRFHWKGKLLNFHLMAIPLFERHTGVNMFVALRRFLVAVFTESWSQKCISVSSDGARNMSGSVQGLVTRILNECPPGIIRIWCGLHQLDLIMQRVFKPALDTEFYSTLVALIGYLRRQFNLIAEMRSTCPKVADTRWMSMFGTTKWLVQNRVRIQQHLNSKKPACTPDTLWWIFLHAIQAFASESKIVFTSLQGLTTIVSEQRRRLNGLIDTYCRMSGMEGPISSEQIDEITTQQPAVVCAGKPWIVGDRVC